MGVVAATRRGKKTDDGLLGFSLFTYAAPEYWIGIILILVFAVAMPIFPAGQQMTPGVEFSSWFARGARRRRAPDPARDRDDADAARPVLPDHALVDGRRADRGLHHRQARDRAALASGSSAATRSATRCCRWSRCRRSSSAPSSAARSRSRRSSPGRASASSPSTRSTTRTSRCCRARSSSSRAGVIFANLLADCLYFYLDPRVQSR